MEQGYFEVHIDVEDTIEVVPPRFLEDVAQAMVGTMAQFGMKVAVNISFTQAAFACNIDEENKNEDSTGQ